MNIKSLHNTQVTQLPKFSFLKKLVTPLFIFMVFTGLRASATIYTVGTGTTSTTTSGVTPFSTLYEDSRIQYLYLASELTGAGASAGLINSIAFNITSLNTFVQPTNVNIKVGTTSALTITSLTPGLTPYFSAATLSPTLGWNTYTFGVPFLWNGTDNIIIEVCVDNSTWDGNYGVETFQFPTGDTRTFGYYDDGVAGCAMTTGSTATATNLRRRPNAQFDIVPAIACSGTPVAGVASGPAAICPNLPLMIAATGATTGTGLIYQWKSSPAGMNTWSDIAGANSTTLNLPSGQTTATDYHLLVTCTNGGFSDSTNDVSVTINGPTACYCTPLYGTGCGDDDDLNSYILTGENSTGFNDLNTGCSPGAYADKTALPAVQLAQGGIYSGMINSTYTSVYENANMWIDFGDDGIFDPTDTVGSVGPFSTTLVPFTITIPSTATLGTHRMRVRVVYDEIPNTIVPCASYGYGETHDYMVTIIAPPMCPAPITLSTGTITSATAALTWAQPNATAQWSVEYGPAGFAPGTGTFVSVTTNPGTSISGLSPNTSYAFYARAICSSTDSSAQAGPFVFVTAQIPAIPPYAENWETGGTAWTYVNNGQTNKWVAGTATSNTGTGSLYVSGDNGLTNTYNTNSASTVHAYRDFDFTTLSGTIPVSFNWRADGEAGWDTLGVWIVPMSYIPVAGTAITSASGGVLLNATELSTQTTFTAANLAIPASFAGGQARLVFQWSNDSNTGNNPPAAIDNLSVGGIPLSIELLDIKAINAGKRNRVDWQTATEASNDMFDLERSADNRNFSRIATINAKGSPSAYSFWDEQPVNGVNYYRLKMNDENGTHTYSKTVSAKVSSQTGITITAFPNPVGDDLTVRVSGIKGAGSSVNITDVSGKIVSTHAVPGAEITISTAHLTAGVYFVNYNDDNHTETIKFQKK